MNSKTITPLLLAATAIATLLLINCKKQKDTPAPQQKNTPAKAIPVDPATLPPATRQIATQVPVARAILNKWRLQNPGTGERKLHIILWTPSDRDPAPRHQERLSTILIDIQKFYRQQMHRIGFPDHTLKFDHNPDNTIKIHTITGQKPYAQYAVASGNSILQECTPYLKEKGINPDKETIVIFCNMSVWNQKHRTIRQNSPYYAKGSSTEGIAWQVDSPILELKSLTDMKNRVRDGQYGNITLGKYNTIFIGGIAHELGHALGLPHNKERPDEARELGGSGKPIDANAQANTDKLKQQNKYLGIALMGSGNRAYGDELRGDGQGAFLTLAHGLKLATHPIFSGHTARMHENPETKLQNLNLKNNGKSITVTGNITGKIPPYAVIAYMDPQGNSDYNATTTTAIPDENGNFTLHCDALAPGKNAKLKLVALHANGQHTSSHGSNAKYTYPYTVDKNGNVDITTAQITLELTPLINAITKNQPATAALLPTDASKKSIAIATRLINSKNQKRPLPTPAEIPNTKKQIPLTDTTPTRAKVGYGKITYDRSPAGLLDSGQEIHPFGAFAHAPSNITYNLDGKWKKLTGSCALAPGTHGKAAFTIIADGKTLFTSPAITHGAQINYNIDLTNIKTLELITTDGGDGITSDHTLWLSPTLTR